MQQADVVEEELREALVLAEARREDVVHQEVVQEASVEAEAALEDLAAVEEVRREVVEEASKRANTTSENSVTVRMSGYALGVLACA